MAKKISNPPSSASTVSGYTDQPTNATWKVTDNSHSNRSMTVPMAMIAPPKMYNLPFRKYHSSTTTVVTIRPTLTVTGSAKLKYHLPPVSRLISSKYSADAAKSQGTKITGLGFRNQIGSASTTYASTSAPAVSPWTAL